MVICETNERVGYTRQQAIDATIDEASTLMAWPLDCSKRLPFGVRCAIALVTPLVWVATSYVWAVTLAYELTTRADKNQEEIPRYAHD